MAEENDAIYTQQQSSITDSSPLKVCNAFWGNRLASQPHFPGSDCINFSTLWPDKRTFLDLYKMCTMSEICYDLVKLLLTSNTLDPLIGLLNEGLLTWDYKFPGNMTLAHLVCVLNPSSCIQLLSLTCNSTTDSTPWTIKDNEGRDPLSVCFSYDARKGIRKIIKGIGNKNKGPNVGLALTQDAKDHIFALAAAPEGLYDMAILLQTYSCDVNKEKDDEGNTLMHLAVQGGLSCLPHLFYLVNTCGGDITVVTNELKMTPACLAAKIGDEKMTELLICVFGAGVNSTDQLVKWTLLHYASRHNHPQLIRVLLDRGADANKEDSIHCLPSFLAQRYGHNECYRTLTHHLKEKVEDLAQQATEGTLSVTSLTKADICVVTKDGFTLLMKAVLGNRPSTVKALVSLPEFPKDFRQMKLPDEESLEDSTGLPTVPSLYDQTLKTAVTLAAENGFTECLRILLEAGAHPALEDNQRWLPIHYAAINGHKESVKALVSLKQGLTGLHLATSLATSNGRGDIVSILKTASEKRQKEIVTPILFEEVAVQGDKDLLYQTLEDGDDVNPINEVSEWPLYRAAGSGHLEIVKMLYEHGGVVVRHHSLNLSTPLHQAAMGGYSEVVKFLLDFCRPNDERLIDPNQSYLDINEKNAMGSSPLELATSMGHNKVVQILLDHGAVTTLPDSNGRLLSCPAFCGIQFLLESRRKELMNKIAKAIMEQKTLKEFKLLWKSPSDFNLRDNHGDTVLMISARYSKPDILEFLLQSASLYTPEMKIKWSQDDTENTQYSNGRVGGRRHRRTNSRDFNTSFEDSYTSDTPYAYGRRRTTIDNMSRPSTALDPNFGRNRRSTNRSRLLMSSYNEQYTAYQYPTTTATEESSDDESFSEDDYNTTNNRPRLGNPVSRNQYAVVGAPQYGSQYGGQYGGPGSQYGGVYNGTTTANDDTPSGPCTVSGLVCLTSLRDRRTALHRAVEGNQFKLIPLLLMADPKVANMQDKNGQTALHLACQLNLKSCINALFNFRGIKIDTILRDVSNKMAEDLAIKPRLKKMVAKYRLKQLKESHPANRPLPPIPPQPPYMDVPQPPQHTSPVRYTSTPVIPSSPYDAPPLPVPPSTHNGNSSLYQSRTNISRQLMLVPEDGQHVPSTMYGMTMEEDMRNGGGIYNGMTQYRTAGNPQRAQSTVSLANNRRGQPYGYDPDTEDTGYNSVSPPTRPIPTSRPPLAPPSNHYTSQPLYPQVENSPTASVSSTHSFHRRMQNLRNIATYDEEINN